MTDGSALRILGIDPGSSRTGWGIVEEVRGRLRLVAAGAVKTPDEALLPERVLWVFQGLETLIGTHRPQEVAVEGLFHARNARSALVLGHARGVALLAAARAGLPVWEYAPRTVKRALVGNGDAEKEQVRTMVRLLLGLNIDLKPLDASDGVAIAICHAHSRRLAALAAPARTRPAAAPRG